MFFVNGFEFHKYNDDFKFVVNFAVLKEALR